MVVVVVVVVVMGADIPTASTALRVWELMDLMDRFARSSLTADANCFVVLLLFCCCFVVVLLLFCCFICLLACLLFVCLSLFNCFTYYSFTYLNCLFIYLLARALYLPELSKLVEVEPLPALQPTNTVFVLLILSLSPRLPHHPSHLPTYHVRRRRRPSLT